MSTQPSPEESSLSPSFGTQWILEFVIEGFDNTCYVMNNREYILLSLTCRRFHSITKRDVPNVKLQLFNAAYDALSAGETMIEDCFHNDFSMVIDALVRWDSRYGKHLYFLPDHFLIENDESFKTKISNVIKASGKQYDEHMSAVERTSPDVFYMITKSIHNVFTKYKTRVETLRRTLRLIIACS